MFLGPISFQYSCGLLLLSDEPDGIHDRLAREHHQLHLRCQRESHHCELSHLHRHLRQPLLRCCRELPLNRHSERPACHPQLVHVRHLAEKRRFAPNLRCSHNRRSCTFRRSSSTCFKFHLQPGQPDDLGTCGLLLRVLSWI